MKGKILIYVLCILLIMCLTGCENNKTIEEISSSQSETTMTQENYSDNDYYVNEKGYLVDKVTEFETLIFGEYTLKCPVLNEGIDEVVVYEFDTYDGVHVIIDASNVYQQTNLDAIGDYGDVQLEEIAPGKDVVYMFDGERYYIEDYARNVLTITKPMNN